jgi:hypothetical protein
MAATLFFPAALVWLWDCWHAARWRTLLVGSFFTAGLFLSKFSAPLFIPFALVLMAVRVIVSRPMAWRLGREREIRSRAGLAGAALAILVAQGLLVWAAIWASYGFHYSMRGPDAPPIKEFFHGPPDWQELVDRIGGRGKVIAFVRDWRLLPEAYLAGMAHTLALSDARTAFFMGDVRNEGWFLFFPVGFLIKTPLSFLILLALAVQLAWQSRPWRGRFLYAAAPLVVLTVGYWGVAVMSSLNIGVRHLLPTMPALCIFAGATWHWANRADSRLRLRRWLLATLVVCYVGEALASWPNYIAYFNPAIGGPTRGYRWLIDSSLDWGQDLPSLAQWLEAHHDAERPAYLSYFGTASPGYYGVKARWLPGFSDMAAPAGRPPAPLEPGTYCVSASMLQGVYYEPYGAWNEEYELAYVSRRLFLLRWLSLPAGPDRDKLEKTAKVANVDKTWAEFESLRMARMFSFLRQRAPDHQVCFSILIYEVSADDLEEMLNGPSPDLFRKRRK